MPAKVSVPDSLSSLLHRFRSCFTAPGYEVFTAMFTGFILRPLERTVCGMLTGAGLAGVWHHSRAHRFFAGTRWDVRQVGLILAALVVELLLPPDAAILLAIDETLTRRRGPKVFAASWWHDGSAAGAKKIGYGNSWVVLAIVVTVPFCRRPIALPILFALCVKGGRSKPDLGRDHLDQVAEAFPTRTIHLVGDAAYGAGHFAGLGRNITLTTRARSNAVFHHPTPAASGKRGRPRLRGERIGTPTDIATRADKNNTWVDTLINRYGTTITARTTEITGLWFGVWRTDPVRVILVKDSHRKTTTNKDFDIAIVTTDMTAAAAEIVARYASRWSIEVCFHDAPYSQQLAAPASAKPRTEPKKQSNGACLSHSWPRPSPSCGTPPTPNPKRKSPNAAETPPGTQPKPTRPRWTCSTPCATRSPRTELTAEPQVTPHPNKTRITRSAPNEPRHELRKSRP